MGGKARVYSAISDRALTATYRKQSWDMAACRLVRDAERCVIMRALLTVDGGVFAKDTDDTGRTPLFYASTRAGLHALLAANATDVNAKDAAGRDAVAHRIVEGLRSAPLATAVHETTVKEQARA